MSACLGIGRMKICSSPKNRKPPQEGPFLQGRNSSNQTQRAIGCGKRYQHWPPDLLYPFSPCPDKA
nr:MAG TPA: hypothetical protein [Caudoviricetes sp.]